MFPAQIVVIGAFSLIFYIYLGYPLLLWVLSRFFKKSFRSGSETPTVTLVIAAHNEEAVIARKLENSLALDYPGDRLSFAVASDASTDGTNAIVAGFRDRGVRLFAFSERGGKIAALNRVVPQLDSEIIVMSDANGMYDPRAVRRLVRHFSDPRIGCVCGELRYTNPGRSSAGRGESAYWRYEVAVKKMESAMGHLLGANGGIFAFRRVLREPVPPVMANDFVTPVKISLRGYHVIYDPEALCFEQSSQTMGNEFRRHSRFASRGLIAGCYLLALALRRLHLPMIFTLISHRLLRWLSGTLLITALIANAFTLQGLWGMLFGGQLLFYLSALMGFGLTRLGRRFRPLTLPYYFCMLNLAGLAGLFQLATGRVRAQWSTKER